MAERGVPQQATLPAVLYGHTERIRRLERVHYGRWIYVGTVGVDGIDDLLEPAPFGLSPPFTSPWHNLGGVDPITGLPRALCQFYVTPWGEVRLRGSVTGGDPGTEIFKVPVIIAPDAVEPALEAAGETGANFATVHINPNGSVIFVGSV